MDFLYNKSFAEREAEFYNGAPSLPLPEKVLFSDLNPSDKFRFDKGGFIYSFMGIESTLFETNFVYTSGVTEFREPENKLVLKHI